MLNRRVTGPDTNSGQRKKLGTGRIAKDNCPSDCLFRMCTFHGETPIGGTHVTPFAPSQSLDGRMCPSFQPFLTSAAAVVTGTFACLAPPTSEPSPLTYLRPRPNNKITANLASPDIHCPDAPHLQSNLPRIRKSILTLQLPHLYSASTVTFNSTSCLELAAPRIA